METRENRGNENEVRFEDVTKASMAGMRSRSISRRGFFSITGAALAALAVGGVAGCSSASSGSAASASASASASAASASTSAAASDASASAAAAATRAVTNLDGSVINVPATVDKVAAIFGPSYERIVAVGAEDAIVCDGDFHINGWPWSNVIYKRINDVPGIPNAHSDLNVEDLVAQGVQVVFCFPNPSQAEAINNAGMVAIPMASTGKFHDIADTLTLYADVFGTDIAKQRAADYTKYFEDMVKMVQERTKGVSDADRPAVYLAYTDLLHGYGAKSDMVEVLNLAGGKLASIDLEGGSNIEVTAEQLLQWNPDFIFVDHAGSSGNASAEDAIAAALATGDFNNITAVQNNAVAATPTGVFFWDAGIQKILYLVYIAKTIHPDLFEDVDMKALLVDFYKKFFDYSLTDDQATRILNHQDPA